MPIRHLRMPFPAFVRQSPNSQLHELRCRLLTPQSRRNMVGHSRTTTTTTTTTAKTSTISPKPVTPKPQPTTKTLFQHHSRTTTMSTNHTALNSHAALGFAASTDYDTHRPSYPAASVQELLTGCRVAGKRGARIVDLAAGTGKFTELLCQRDEEFEIIAIEPHDGMREVLERKQLPRVRVVSGTAGEMGGLEEGAVDCVIAAQVGLGLSYSLCILVGLRFVAVLSLRLSTLLCIFSGFPLVRYSGDAARGAPCACSARCFGHDL